MLRARKAGAAVVSSLAAVVLVACGADQGAEQDASATGASTTQATPSGTTGSTDTREGTTEPAVTVPEKLKFTSTTLEGAEFSGESLAGEAAVLWFWAPWCPNCAAEAPAVAETAGTHAGEVTFLGVASQDEVGKMKDFVREHDLGGFTHLQDTGGEVWTRFDVTYQPAYAFISEDGTIEVVKNQLPAAELAERVDRLAGA
ncbi:thiol-disulfide isomerase/thioredoxin [Amycolatopsis cihanbeyliensis]|uniref:Thiol-disulfide isomerase/thioredoxin n=2 Tax=Amycolatopsis cihanbeyliensis TaxID=1128664 RepID=A0A542DR16_AMYCI|nr:thiol-disulfide isomerase/thioredoxin [Amycolatopsis cihanbeyliensis]